jgi:hypothetical protein
MSSAARVMIAVTLVTVPTIVYGGLTILSVVTGGAAGAPAPPNLNPVQVSLYRAGHAHAGVLVILSLLLQVFLDATSLPPALSWSVRVCAPAAAVLVSGGFFGLAYLPALRFLLYAGAALVTFSTVTTAVGLFRG